MIVARLRGGLGNQMFQYAAGRARAKELGEGLALDLSWFGSPGALEPRRTYDLGIFAMKPRFATRGGALIAKALGKYNDKFFQSEDHFRGASMEVRGDFKFARGVVPASKELADRIGACDSVCVNVRRTDFVTGGIFVGTDYYRRAVSRMLESVPRAESFVFSDDVEWCRENLGFIPRATFVGHEHAGEKFGNYLQLMTMCKHFIIPNSTFGWWAAWLGADPAKTVIATADWPIEPGMQAHPPVPQGWLRL